MGKCEKTKSLEAVIVLQDVLINAAVAMLDFLLNALLMLIHAAQRLAFIGGIQGQIAAERLTSHPFNITLFTEIKSRNPWIYSGPGVLRHSDVEYRRAIACFCAGVPAIDLG